MPDTISEVLSYAKRYLSDHHITSSAIDSLVLLMHTINKSKVEILTYPNMEVSKADLSKFKELLEKRIEGSPVQYITKHCEFMSLPFIVTPNVLIPRPDTEILVETALESIGGADNVIMDIGCGSGCISVSIGYYAKNVSIVAVDISKQAIETAKNNAILNNVFEKIAFVESDLFQNINSNIKVDVLISNPPYIPTSELETLPIEVNHEPQIALDGGIDGLRFYRIIAKYAKNYLCPRGHLMLEIGYNQYNDVRKILECENYCNINSKNDLAGYRRVITATSAV